MKICYLTGRESNYPRNNIIAKGLEQKGVEVILCTDNTKSIARYVKTMKNYIINKGSCDIVLVGFFGQPLMPFARYLTNKKIIFDAFLSSYDTMVFDRKKVGPNSMGGRFFHFLDKYSCSLADNVLLDTYQHIDYFCEEFNLNSELFSRVFIGADDSIFYPREEKKEDSTFLVHFHGNFIPLQGIEFILKAAKLLEDCREINFQIIGDGLTYTKNKNLAIKLELKNVKFVGRLPQNIIPEYISKSDICLGIFGSTNKAQRVIPNKAYEVLAMKKPLITADTPAIHELLENRKNVYLCKAANPEDLADAILQLKDNDSLREKIAREGYEIFKERCTPEVIGNEIKGIAEEITKD